MFDPPVLVADLAQCVGDLIEGVGADGVELVMTFVR